MSSRRYHWEAKQGVRNAKAEKIVRVFSFEERCNRKRIAAAIGEMPSPRCSSWYHYIQHRLDVMDDGIENFTCRSYARLRLDKHIESRSALAKIAGKLVHHSAAIIYIGASGSTPPNSPIRTKKYVRCPGTRKLFAAFLSRGNCVIRMDDFTTLCTMLQTI